MAEFFPLGGGRGGNCNNNNPPTDIPPESYFFMKTSRVLIHPTSYVLAI